MLRELITGTHSVPLFEGQRSHRHRQVRPFSLALQSWPRALRRRGAYANAEAFVQFAAFPRCGHSLIGSIIDAHPRAVISHELDAMGLLRKGLPDNNIFALIERNSQEFTRNGRWWNGFRHFVPRQFHGPPAHPKVIGDKKGDWALRWVERQPGLLDLLKARVSIACKWIAVLRNPFDNIATMTLRRTSEFDRLRIATSGTGRFADALRQAQEEERIASQADDRIIDDYEALCRSLERIRSACADGNFLEVRYEEFVAHPARGIGGLLAFLGLDADEAFVSSASGIVHSRPHESRHLLRWRDDQLRRVNALSAEFSFLSHYSGSEWAP